MAKDVPKKDKQGIASKGLRLAPPPEEGIQLWDQSHGRFVLRGGQ